MMNRDELFAAQRHRLFGIAYRMLGSVADAEDVLQDSWLRWREKSAADIDNPGAYLTRIVTSVSIDALRRAQRRRETYSGPWLPEPLDLDAVHNDDGAAHLALAETLSTALLVMLEDLTAKERATFILREAFGLSFDEIAACLDARPATCRQWAKRARDRLGAVDWRNRGVQAERELLERFVVAMASGEPATMVALLDAQVELIGDGGGKVAAASKPLHGVHAVSRFLGGLAARNAAQVETRLDAGDISGRWIRQTHQRVHSHPDADGKALFTVIENVENLTIDQQADLLLLMEKPSGNQRRNGSRQAVRLITLAGTDLERACHEGRFRKDLYHRLSVLKMTLPPLRDRKDDVPLLADFFASQYSIQNRGAIFRLPDEVQPFSETMTGRAMSRNLSGPSGGPWRRR